MALGKKQIIKGYGGNVTWQNLTPKEQKTFNGRADFLQKKDSYNDDTSYASTLPNATDSAFDIGGDDTTGEYVRAPGAEFLDQYVGYNEIDQGYYVEDREDRQIFTGNQNDLDRLHDIALTNINNASNEAVAGIYADATKFGHGVTLSGYNLLDARTRDLTKYTTTIEDARLRDFKTQDITYGLNLQNIINSGLADVANIQGTYQVSGIATRGKFDKQIQEIRSAGEQDIARTNMMGTMMAGFWNSIG